MNLKNYLLLLTLAAGGFSAAADAKCTRAYVCDDQGLNCKHQEICGVYTERSTLKVQAQPTSTPPPGAPQSILNAPAPLTAKKCDDTPVKGQPRKICE